MTAYATAAQLADFLSTSTSVEDADRLLERASELVDDHVRAWFDVNADTDLPSDADVAAALRDATCAQVEFWQEVGEEHDVSGLHGRAITVGSLQINRLPPELAPRAARILRTAGLTIVNGIAGVVS